MMVTKFCKILILLGCIISASSCSSQNVKSYNDDNTSLVGRYIKNNYPYKNPNYEEIIISKDSVKYKLSLELYGKHVLLGTWKREKDTLNLLFDFPPIPKKGELIVKFESQKQKDILITFKDVNGNILDGSIIFVNDNKHLLNLEPLKMKAQFIELVKVNYFGEFYEVKIDKYVDSNTTIVLNPTKGIKPIYEFFNTKWLIRTKKLILLKDNVVDESYFLSKK